MEKRRDMGYAELIEHLQALPQDKQAEAFDFVEFLLARSGAAGPHPHGEWSDSEFAAMAIAQALRGLKDDPVSYSQADLRDRWL
jgi:hypothetical protein